MDVGLGNGLRNELARAFALSDRVRARILISTTYVLIAVIICVLILLFHLINLYLAWDRILGTPSSMAQELSLLAEFVFAFFCFRLLFGLIGTILIADQKPALSSLFEVLSNFLSLGAVYILTKTIPGSLFWLGFSVAMLSAAVPLGGNFWYFLGRYKVYAPSFHFVQLRHARVLISIGVQFFMLQLAGVVIFASANLIITQLFGPDEVTPYNIAYRYYGFALAVFTTLLTPFWSAYTDAYTRGDMQWITMSLKKLTRAWGILVVLLVAMTLASEYLYALWIGHEVHVPLLISLFMASYVLIVAWSNIFAYFINGTGKIRLQLWIAAGTAVTMIPLALFLPRVWGLGSAGVILAICLSLLPGCVLWPIQVKQIIRGTAKGIWAR
jgi:O-antigen/teichoic acid export membrane protein